MAKKMLDQPAVKIFRPSRAIIIMTGISMLLFMSAAIGMYITGGLTLLGVAGIALAIFAVIAFIDTLLSRVIIFPEELEIYSNFRRRNYPRSAFISAAWAKGCPVSLQFGEGGWLRLPPVGSTSQGMVNTLRAWLNSKNKA
jgi:hypothetical protein